MKVELATLLAYAEANPETLFDMRTGDRCLASAVLGGRIVGYYAADKIGTRKGDMVDSKFSQMVYTLDYETYVAVVFSGAALAGAIRRLMADEPPATVAEWLVREHMRRIEL